MYIYLQTRCKSSKRSHIDVYNTNAQTHSNYINIGMFTCIHVIWAQVECDMHYMTLVYIKIELLNVTLSMWCWIKCNAFGAVHSLTNWSIQHRFICILITKMNSRDYKKRAPNFAMCVIWTMVKCDYSPVDFESL